MTISRHPLEKFLGNIINKIHNALDFAEILKVIVEQTQDFLQVDRVKIYQFAIDGSGEVIAEAVNREKIPSLLGLHFPDSDIPQSVREEWCNNPQSIVVDVSAQRKFLHPMTHDFMTGASGSIVPRFIAVDPCHIQYLLAMGVLSSLSVPIFSQDRLWGMVAIHHSEPRRFSEQELETVELISKEVALAVTQENLVNQVRHQTYQESITKCLNILLSSSVHSSEIWQQVLKECGTTLQGDAGFLYLASDLTGKPEHIYEWSIAYPLNSSVRNPFWQSLMQPSNFEENLSLDQVVLEQQHQVQSSWEKPREDFYYPQAYSRLILTQNPNWPLVVEWFTSNEIQSLLLIPLCSQYQWVGCLVIFRKEQERIKRWAGRQDFDIRNHLPRQSFELWEEKQRYVPGWTLDSLKLAQSIGTQLYMNVTQQFLTRLINHQTAYDPLTQLPNWIIFNQRLTLALLDALYQGGILAVLVIAMDRFKRINENLGHGVGDYLLQQVATRLQTQLELFGHHNPLLSRWHGDGFTILVSNLNYTDEVIDLCQGVLGIFQEPFYVQGQSVYLTASLGISLAPYDGETAEILLKHAETALSQAKYQGKNNYQFYRPPAIAHKLDNLSLETDLRQALQRDELLLYYQPQLDLLTGKLVGLEALLRWQHPHLGFISPGDFIPLAEETGLIEVIGRWVLRTACYQYQQWQKNLNSPLYLAINLSARQFQKPGLVEEIFSILAETGMSPDCLELEITESLMMQDIEGTVKILHQLKQSGIQIAIDDFGTGYSSLCMLKHLPIHTLKIDKSFMDDFLDETKDAAIIQCIIDLGKGLNLKVVAEGIETEQQLMRLREMNCDYVQGFFVSRPIPAMAVSSLLLNPQLIRFQLNKQEPDSKGIESQSQIEAKSDTHYHPLISAYPISPAMPKVEENLEPSIPNLSLSTGVSDRTELSERLRQYAALQDDLRQRSLREKMVMQIAKKIRLSLNINDILNTTVAEVRHFLNTDRVMLYQFDERWVGQIVVESCSAHCKSILHEVIDDPCFKESYVKYYRQGRVRAVEDIHQANLAECHIDLLAYYEVQANLVVPIIFQDKLWGLLISHHCRSSRRWEDHELQLLSELSTQIAIAIHQGELYRQLETANLQLQTLSSQDSLTQVGNRHLFDHYLAQEWQKLRRNQSCLTLILCDVDYFKRFNDYYGHPSGDRCLQDIAQVMRSTIKRPADLVARYGGEEFAIILPNTTLEGAIHVAERIRTGIKELAITHHNSPYGIVTLSMGVALVTPTAQTSIEELVAAADKALYQAKSNGRDQVCWMS
jgi:diguanylate cyclase (GGDEF)-like protein